MDVVPGLCVAGAAAGVFCLMPISGGARRVGGSFVRSHPGVGAMGFSVPVGRGA